MFPGVVVNEGDHVRDSILMAETVIGENSLVNYCILDEQVKIGEKCVVGGDKVEAEGITVIARGVTIKKNANIDSCLLYTSRCG